MYPAKPLLTKVAMSLLTAILTSASVLGNGCVLAVIARFKSLRTVPNIFIANLALVDLFNAVINMPSYAIYTVLEAGWFRGKTLGIMTSIFNRVFSVLNLASMLAMTIDMLLTISFDMIYLAWKSNAKALVCAVLIWIISIVTVMLFSILLFDIDLGDVHVIEYRTEIYKQGKHFVASFMGLFIITCAAICFLTTRAITKKKRKRVELNLPPLQEKARLKDDIKAIKTIGITIAAYFLCYVPAIVYTAVGLQKENLADSWFGFIAWYSLYISSALNPMGSGGLCMVKILHPTAIWICSRKSRVQLLGRVVSRVELNLPPLQEKARLKDDIKAIKTIGITIAAYFLCYVPAIVYAVVGLQKENLADSWFAFVAWYSLYISSALNPIIYYMRASRCRSAFKQFLKDPFGSSDFKENPNGRGNGGNRHDKVTTRKRNGERGKGGEVFKADNIQYSGEGRNAITMSFIKELDDNLPTHPHYEVGDGSECSGEKGKNGGEALVSNREVQNLCQGKVVDTAEEVSVEVPKIRGFKEKTRKQQPSSSGNKVNPLKVSDTSQTWELDGAKRELDRHCTKTETESQGFPLANQANVLSTGDESKKVVKAAWVDKE